MVKLYLARGGACRSLPSIVPGDPSASFTDRKPTGDELVIVTCAADDSQTTVQVSKAGVHVEYGIVREIHSADLELERIVEDGETYRRRLHTQQGLYDLVIVHRKGSMTMAEITAERERYIHALLKHADVDADEVLSDLGIDRDGIADLTQQEGNEVINYLKDLLEEG